MPSYRQVLLPIVVLVLLCAACSSGASDDEAPAVDSVVAGPAGVAVPDSPGSGTTGGAWEEPEMGVDSSGSGAGVTVRYEHTMTCSNFLGHEGQYFVYRIVGIRNGGTTPFTLEIPRLRFPSGEAAGAAPAFAVPEFSDQEVPVGETQPSVEVFMLQRTASGPPPRGPVPLQYDTPDVEMIRGSAEPAYDTGDGCAGYNT